MHRRSNFKMYIHVYININTYIYLESHKKASQHYGMLPVKRTIKNNKFLYRQPC